MSGPMTRYEPIPIMAYGISKAMRKWLVAKMAAPDYTTMPKPATITMQTFA